MQYELLAQVSGEVTYNGQTLDSFLPQRTAAYVPQVNIFLPYINCTI